MAEQRLQLLKKRLLKDGELLMKYRSTMQEYIVKGHACIFRKGKKSDPSNYRPISLTCMASKILEHIVHSHVMKHFEHYNLLTDSQHAFR